jgi:AcrR family transcriptional regulator
MSPHRIDTSPLDRPAGARGRPRSAECDAAILDATWRLLGEVGYIRLSMERIAAEAGVGKPTLYLRYAGKAEVVAAAFVRERLHQAPVPTGDLRADVAAQLDHLRGVMDGTGMGLLGTCLVEEERVPHLIDLLRERSLRPGRRLLRDILDGGIARGEVAADADIPTAVSMAIGSFYATRIAGEPFDEGWADRVAGAVLRMVGAGG